MSKVEERGKIYALHKASEKLHDYYGNAMLSVVQFDGNDIKNAYIEGCLQAEKDLELGWEDIREICRMWIESKTPFGVTGEALSIEVLKRFKEIKNNRT